MLLVDYFNVPWTFENGFIASGSGTLTGLLAYNFSDTDAAQVILVDGVDSNGDTLLQIGVPVGQTFASTLSHDGVRFNHGLYMYGFSDSMSITVFAALDARQPVSHDH